MTWKYTRDDIAKAREMFTNIMSLYRNLNYSAEGTPEYDDYRKQIVELADKHAVAVETKAQEVEAPA